MSISVPIPNFSIYSKKDRSIDFIVSKIDSWTEKHLLYPIKKGARSHEQAPFNLVGCCDFQFTT